MKTNLFKLLFLVAATALCASASAQIKSPEDRAAKLAKAVAMLDNQIRPIEEGLLAHAFDPFRLDLGKTVKQSVTVKAVHTDAELLNILSKQINPTGTIAIGSEYYLLLKEKTLKAGMELSVMYNSTEYKIKVTEITSVSYVVAYGESELQLKLK